MTHPKNDIRSRRPCAWTLGGAVALVAVASFGRAATAAPPPPTGPHPRLFMDADTLAAFTANAAKSGSKAAIFAKRCQDTIDHPEFFMDRGGTDGDNFPGAAVATGSPRETAARLSRPRHAPFCHW